MTDTIPVRVKRIRREAIDILSFRLVHAEGKPLPPFTPGSHIDVYLGPGLLRQYSLCNGSGDRDGYAIAVKQEAASRGGSAAMHGRIREGDLLTIGTPRNTFGLDGAAGETLLIAGGIGVTPMISMASHLLARGASFQLHYFTRSLEHAAFLDLLSAPAFHDKVHFHPGLEPSDVRDVLHRLLRERPEEGHLYICGPRPLMELVQVAAAPAWPSAVVHLEHFGAESLTPSGPQAAFEVVLARTGGTYLVSEGRSIVEVPAEHGVTVDVSCEQGICGTCLTRVLEGVPDHRDMFLTDGEKEAGQAMTICVSRAKGRALVLDL